MVEILGLSKEEQTAVEQHLVEVRKAMEKLEDADTTFLKQTANSVTYEVPADPQGKALKDQLSNTLTSDIGADRADFLLSSSGFENFGPFSGFAEQKKGY